jgi:calcium-dependent protein kinase
MKDGRDVYKITDFGLSSTKELVMTSKIGTAYYVSPEIVDGRAEKEGYDRTIDIWALGLVFDELLHGTTYYNAGTEEEVFTKIRNEPYVIRDKSYNEASFFDTMNFIIQQVLLNTIQREPSKRKDLSWVVD